MNQFVRTAMPVSLLAIFLASPASAQPSSPPDSVACRIYAAIADEPELDDYPIYVRSVRPGRVTVEKPSTEAMTGGLRGGFKNRMKQLGPSTEKQMKAAEIINSEIGLRDFRYTDDSERSLDDIRADRDAAVVEQCMARARLHVESVPEGSELRIDGEVVGTTPISLELVAGGHVLELNSDGYAPERERLLMNGGEERTVRLTMSPRTTLRIYSQPSGAVAFVDDVFSGVTPIEIYVDPGVREVSLRAPGHRVDRTQVDVVGLDAVDVTRTLSPDENTCPTLSATGPVDRAFKTLRDALVGRQLELMMPLWGVVTSSMGRILPATHVVDGRQILFEPKRGDRYVPHPEDLLGRELGGLSFGETASDLAMLPPGMVTITAVEKSKTTFELEVRGEAGDTSRLYIDATAGLDRLDATDLADAMCMVFGPAP